jgi:hypothetical protein
MDQAGNVSPRPCGNMSWIVDSTAPELSVISPANNTVTRSSNITLNLQANEPLSGLLVLQPGATVLSREIASSQLVVVSYSERQQQALKGNVQFCC